MAEKFYQLLYAGIDRPSNSWIIQNGVSMGRAGYKGVFYGANSNVQSPIVVTARITGNYTIGIGVGSGFIVASTDGSSSYQQSISSNYGNNIFYFNVSDSPGTFLVAGDYIPFADVNEAIIAFIDSFNVEGYRNIKYNGTGCSLIGDSFLPVGSTAHAYVTPNLGGSISESGITVKRAGADVPFTYANGIITFTVT